MSFQKNKTLSTDAGGEPEAMYLVACHSVHSSVSCLFWPQGGSHDKVKG